MNCIVSGILGISLIAASFSTMTVSEQQKMYLQKYLDEEQQQKYCQIVHERRNLYLQGIVLGILISFCLSSMRTYDNDFHRVFYMVAVTLLVAVGYYSVMPKSDYMLRHLKSSRQNKAWLKVYRTMKSRYLFGFILGLSAAIPISYSMCLPKV